MHREDLLRAQQNQLFVFMGATYAQGHGLAFGNNPPETDAAKYISLPIFANTTAM